MKLEIAKPIHAPAIVALVNACYRGDSSRKGWTTEADFIGGQRTDPEAILEMMEKSNQLFLIGFSEGQLVVSVNLEKKNSKTCYFGMFAVDPSLQSKGLGKQVVADCEQFAKDQWQSTKMEMVVLSIRDELIEWYQRRGYQKSPELRPFPYGNERFGTPLRDDLKLQVLEKDLSLI